MARLYVLVAGVFGIVVPKASDPVMVLLRDIQEGTVVCGKEVPKHLARARFRSGGGLKTELLNQGDAKFVPSGSGGCQIELISGFLHLDDFDVSSPSVKRGCVGANPKAECQVNGKPALSGRVMFNGGAIWPVYIRDIFDAREVFYPLTIKAVGGVRLKDDNTILERKGKPKKVMANGILYERRLDDAQVELDLGGGRKFKLEPGSGVAEVGSLPHDPQEEIFVVWVVNTIDPGSSVKPIIEKFDRDFHLLYDFLEDADKAPRWIPELDVPALASRDRYMTREDGADDKPGGDPPGKCMPALIKA